jgi:hypothetical protein
MSVAKRLDVSSSDITRASLFGVGLLTLLAFAASLFSSTSAFLLWGSAKNQQGHEIFYGIGPFIAGASTKNSDVVWWSELTGENACAAKSAISVEWATKNGLCDGKRRFIVPGATTAIQVMSSLSTALSFIACSVAFSWNSRKAVAFVAICSFGAMLCSCIHFALWATHPLAIHLQDHLGDVVPLWESGKEQELTISPRVSMGFGVSYLLFIASFVMLLLGAAIAYGIFRLPLRYFQVDDDEGSYGLGKL